MGKPTRDIYELNPDNQRKDRKDKCLNTYTKDMWNNKNKNNIKNYSQRRIIRNGK